MRFFSKEHMQFDDKVPMIRRYSLFDTFCIHILCCEDIAPHTHPWNYFTLILWGGYREFIYEEGQKLVETNVRKVGWWTFRSCKVWHTATPLNGKYSVSLFINGKTLQDAHWFFNGKTVDVRKLIRAMGCKGRAFKMTYKRLQHWY